MTEVFQASISQRSASDPGESVWVTANAGSGKTHVLVDRVIRLMLAGSEPARILCLTFTKAAAAEMANRLFEKLAGWTMMPDEDLLEHMTALGHGGKAAPDLGRARRLFTLALESPGGLRIQTIHAFCERLLQLFPVEAGVVPGFTVMDDVLAAATLAEARQQLLSESQDGSIFAIALDGIVKHLQADSFDELVKKLLARRLEFADVLSGSQAVEKCIAELRRNAGLPTGATPETLLADLVAIDQAVYHRMAGAFAASKSKTEAKNLELVNAILGATNSQLRRDRLVECYLTKSGSPRAVSGLITKALAEASGDLADCIVQEQARVVTLVGHLAFFPMLDATRDLLTLASGIVQTFERLKRERGLYDFTDLIDRTRELLMRSGAAPWVLYKLDGGIDHILVDEAQDTSRAQWDIAKSLTEEPFSGSGARGDVHRTVFVVGDRKQSIFSFQGADPVSFDESRLHFETVIRGIGKELNRVELFDSYRSVPGVLRAVDGVFADPAARKGLEETIDVAIQHYAQRKELPGIVELWPLLEFEKSEKSGPLDPVDLEPRNHPRRLLARSVAEKIASWIGRRTISATGRLVRPEDILILVRKRNLVFDALIAELNARGVPVAGADRLKLGEHIAVLDLLSLARFVILPEDDLSLAEVLKSPLVPDALDDDGLYEIANGRGSQSLWQSLKAGRHSRTADYLEALISHARSRTPYEFFNHVLLNGEPSGRKRIYARLGLEAADAIDAFLARVLEDDISNTPSLQGFVSRFEAEAIEIKRDMQQDGGEVRIMTVHGAKGLELCIVIIPDAADLPLASQDMTLLMVGRGEYELPLPFWRCKSDIEPSAVTRWKQEALERVHDEYRRNLYVALTRARDELYVGGVVLRGQLKPESWYALVQAALLQNLNVTPDDSGVLRYQDGDSLTAVQHEQRTDTAAKPLPSWARLNPARGTHERPWLRPSDPGPKQMDEPGLSPLAARDVRRFQRGTLIHKLLQLLPDIEPARRSAAAETFLRRHHTETNDIPKIREEVLNLLDDETFAPWFSGNSLAEVSIASLLGKAETHVSGRIDRLAVTSEAIYLLDFKTERQPPASLAGVNPRYIQQLATYARALREIYPGRGVNAAFLWTVEARLMPVPEKHLS